MMRSPNLHGGEGEGGGVPVPPEKKKVMGGQTARMEAPSHTHTHTPALLPALARLQIAVALMKF